MGYLNLLGSTTEPGFSAVTDGVENIIDLATTMLNTILGNAILATVFAISFVFLGISVVKKLKRG